MIQLSMVMEEGQDLPQRLTRWGDVELHSALVRVANEVLSIYMPQLSRDAPLGVKTRPGEPHLRDSFTGRVQDLGLEVNVNMYSQAIDHLNWVTGGTRPHVIVPVEALALHLEESLIRPDTTGYTMYAEHPGIRTTNQFVNRIKDRIRSFVQYRFQQEIDVSVTRL